MATYLYGCNDYYYDYYKFLHKLYKILIHCIDQGAIGVYTYLKSLTTAHQAGSKMKMAF